MNRRLARPGLFACLGVTLVLSVGMLLAGQSVGRVFPAGEEMVKLGIHTYRLAASASESQRRIEADLLDADSGTLGRIEVLSTPGVERATIRWKGESITLIVHQDHRYEFLHDGRSVVAGERQATAESEEFFRVHAERINILREAGRELWSLAAAQDQAAGSQGKACGQSNSEGGDVSVTACTGEWTWSCNWGVRIFRSWACGDARTRVGPECTTRRCLGCCAFGDCNCACMVGDFSCYCCVDGRGCVPSTD